MTGVVFERTFAPPTVMAGLVPAIHEFARNDFVGRIKATCDWLIVAIESFGLVFF